MNLQKALLLALAICGALPLPALDLNSAVVVTPPKLSVPEQKAVAMLLDEVEKRTQIRWQAAHSWPSSSAPVIAVGTAPGLTALSVPQGRALPAGAAPG